MHEIGFPLNLSLRCGPVTAVDLALFAAASGDHNLLHLDAGVARQSGFDRPVVHGMFTMACAARLFTGAFGVHRLRALQTRFTGSALIGDTLLFEATRVEVIDGEARYTLGARTESGTELVRGSARVSSARVSSACLRSA